MGAVLTFIKNFTGIGGLPLTWPEKILIFFAPFLLPYATSFIEDFNIDVIARIILLNIATIVLLKIRCSDKIDLSNVKTYFGRGPMYVMIVWYIILMVLSHLYLRNPYIAMVYFAMSSFIGNIVLGLLLLSSYRTDAGFNCK